jgi:hypothetical protein
MAAGRPDPRFNKDGIIDWTFGRQRKGYKNHDPGRTYQKAIPYDVLHGYAQQNVSQRHIAAGQLILLAFFFAMRSCEYLHLKGTNTERRTRPIRKCDLVLRKDRRVLPHNSPLLDYADTVAITFRFQKNNTGSKSRTTTPAARTKR